MKVRINVDKVEALKAGLDRHGLVVIDVPASSLSPEQREELARHDYAFSNRNECPADFYLDHLGKSDGCPVIAEAKPEVVPVILDALITHRRAEEAEKKAEHEAAVKVWLDAPVEEWLSEDSYHGWSVKGYMKGKDCPEDDRLYGKLQEAKLLRDRLNFDRQCRKEAEQAERERKAAEAKAQKEVGREALKQWAIANGSALLKARIEDGFEWEGLAETEFSHSIIDQIGADLERADDVPDGYESPTRKERTTPTLEEINTVRSLRKRAEGIKSPIGVNLAWFVYKPEDDPEAYPGEEGEPEAIQRTEIEVVVTCPNGDTRQFYFLPATSNTPAEA